MDLYVGGGPITVQLVHDGTVMDSLHRGAVVGVELWHPEETVTAVQSISGRIETTGNPAWELRDLIGITLLSGALGWLLVATGRRLVRRGCPWTSSWIATEAFPRYEQALLGAEVVAIGTLAAALYAESVDLIPAIVMAAAAFSVWLLAHLLSAEVRDGIAGIRLGLPKRRAKPRGDVPPPDGAGDRV